MHKLFGNGAWGSKNGSFNTTLEATHATTRLETCYLHCPVRGEDIRTELFRHAMKDLRAYHVKELWLGVWQKEEETIRWYTELGFKEVDHYFLEMNGNHYKHFVMDNCAAE